MTKTILRSSHRGIKYTVYCCSEPLSNMVLYTSRFDDDDHAPKADTSILDAIHNAEEYITNRLDNSKNKGVF